MKYDDEKVDEIAKAADALLKLEDGRSTIAVEDMQHSLSTYFREKTDFARNFVVESAEAYTMELDDKSRSGTPEWEALSKSVDEAKASAQVNDADAQRRLANNMAAQAAFGSRHY